MTLNFTFIPSTNEVDVRNRSSLSSVNGYSGKHDRKGFLSDEGARSSQQAAGFRYFFQVLGAMSNFSSLLNQLFEN